VLVSACRDSQWWRIPERLPDRLNRRGLLPDGEQASVHDRYTRVRFGVAAHADLRRGIREPIAAGVETGGLLLGRFDHGLYRVRHVRVADKPWLRRSYSAELDLARCDEIARSFEGTADVLGTWHIHPSDRGVPYPSPADLRSWRSWLDHLTVDRHLGVIVNQDLPGGWSHPSATAFVLTRSGGKTDVETVSVELPALHLLRDEEPVLMVAVADRSFPSLDGSESSFARGYRAWSDHPDVLDFPSAFVPAASEHDGDGPWNFRVAAGAKPPTRLPGGWVRKTRPLRLGEEVWWERPTPTGGMSVYYGDVDWQPVPA
jgi:proteasome lid subunit RPN8/RPN11